MESREQLLTIISPMVISGELEKNPIITKINIIIDFINNNRYRQPEENDNYYQQKYPLATRSSDVALRENISTSLNDLNNIKRLIEQVNQALLVKYSSNRKRQQKQELFNRTLSDFLNHTVFEEMTLVHLTAAELAIVGMTIDTLLILLHQVRCMLQSDDALNVIASKQNEILSARDKVITCMSYHRAVFDKNCELREREEFYHSDIVLNLLNAIEVIAGIRLTDEKNSLWPDMSYLHIVPELRLAKQDEPTLVRQFFADYIISSPPGIQDVNRLADDIKSELNLLERQEEPKKTVALPEFKQESAASVGCFPWFFWSRPAAKTSEHSVDFIFDDELLGETLSFNNKVDNTSNVADDTSVEDVIKLLRNFNEKAQLSLDKFKMEDELRHDINTLRQLLQQEIDELMEPSCFSFFRTGTLRKKMAKKAALDNVFGAATLAELGQRASDELVGANKNLVTAGWHSRTETLLNRIVMVVRIESDSINDVEFSPEFDML